MCESRACSDWSVDVNYCYMNKPSVEGAVAVWGGSWGESPGLLHRSRILGAALPLVLCTHCSRPCLVTRLTPPPQSSPWACEASGLHSRPAAAFSSLSPWHLPTASSAYGALVSALTHFPFSRASLSPPNLVKTSFSIPSATDSGGCVNTRSGSKTPAPQRMDVARAAGSLRLS